jgi:hypothetical protein
MRAAIQPDVAVGILGFVSVLYLFLVLFLLWLMRSVELKLLAVGLLTAVLAVWCGTLGAEGGGYQVSGGPAGGGGRVVLGGDAPGALGRIALVLVLGGVAVILFNRLGYPSVSAKSEEATRANPG